MKELWEPLPPALRDSVPNFSCYLLRELGLADTPTRQQIAVCDWMQNGPDKSLTVAFRGLGKSILASFYALWRLRVDPSEKILVVSATAVKSTDFSSFMLRCIGEVDILQCLMPGPSNRFSNVAFDVGQQIFQRFNPTTADGIDGSRISNFGLVVVEGYGDSRASAHQLKVHVTHDIHTLSTGVEAVGKETEL